MAARKAFRVQRRGGAETRFVAGFGVSPVSVLVAGVYKFKKEKRKRCKRQQEAQRREFPRIMRTFRSCCRPVSTASAQERPHAAHDEVVTAKQPRHEALVIGRASSKSLGFYVQVPRLHNTRCKQDERPGLSGTWHPDCSESPRFPASPPSRTTPSPCLK